MLALDCLGKARVVHGYVKANNVMITAFDQTGQPVVDPFNMAAVHHFTPKLIDVRPAVVPLTWSHCWSDPKSQSLGMK